MLNQHKYIFFLFIFLLFSSSLGAQLQVTSVNGPVYTPESLIENVFLGDGVEVTNILYTGSENAIGAFTNGQAAIGLERGLIMSSGFAESAALANTGIESGANGIGTNDPDLAATTTTNIMDLSRYEITFIPVNDTLRFRYVWASEEYPDFACSTFNDVFGFFIQGPVPGGAPGEMYDWKNIALIPDPLDPSGETFLDFPVTINYVNDYNDTPIPAACSGMNGSTDYDVYYNPVATGSTPTYNAYIDIFIAQAIVTPCEEYTIKLAIADGNDNIYDSAVFLEAKSFGTGSLDVSIETVSLDGSIAEGCDPGFLSFSLPNEVTADFDIDLNIITDPTIPNIATNGVDYETLPTQIVIPAGSNSVNFPLVAFEDGIAEGTEFILFDIQRDICNRDTLRIPIRESIILPPVLPMDQEICAGQSVALDGELDPLFILPEPPKFSYQGGDVSLNNMGQETFSFNFDIEVFGVAPENLSEGVIKSVCIDSMNTLGIDMTIYDFFLIGPDGQILELMTDVGQDPTFGPMDTTFLRNVCFTPSATVNINNGNATIGPVFPSNPSYTGEFAPEGVFSDLWDGDYSPNGTWSLLVFLDEKPLWGLSQGINVFKSWSICFNSVYQVDYEWSPNNGTVDCVNCEDVTVTPTEDSWYYLTLTDSYGCNAVDSVFVKVNPNHDAPEGLICNVLSESEILFDWEDGSVGEEFEVQINGMGPWINVGSVSEYLVGMLGFNETVSLSVRVFSADCVTEEASTTCMTPNCTPPTASLLNSTIPTCPGGNDGKVKIEATGGVGPYTYIYGTQSVTNGQIENLPAGNSIITIIDGNNCEIEFNIFLDEPESIENSFNLINNVLCFGGNSGSVQAVPSNGKPPYSYEWSNAQIVNIATNLPEGFVYVTITDNDMCSIIDSIYISEPTEFNIDSILSKDVTCFGLNNGEAMVFVSGGTSPYTFQWDDPNMTQNTTISDILPGTYFVTATDDNNCFAISNVTIDQPPQLTADWMISDISCFGANDGIGQLNVVGGTPPYEFMWQDMQTTNPATNLSQGAIGVTVTDLNDCALVMLNQINEPNEIVLSGSHVNINCFNGLDGSIDLEAFGGSGMLNYSWDTGDFSQDLTDLIAGTYCVTISDENNCQKDTCFVLTEPQELLVVEEVFGVGCSGSTNGQILLDVSGGTGTYTYSWIGDNAFTATTEDLNGIEAGTYTVSITDENNCSFSNTYIVAEEDPIVVLNTNTDVNCNDGMDGEIELVVSGGTGSYTFSWLGPNGFAASTEDLSNLEFGQYMLTITDSNNCNYINTFFINQPPTQISESISTPDTICFGENNGQLSINPQGGTPPYSILWSNNATGLTLTDLPADVYTVTITDDRGCEQIESSEVHGLGEITISLDLQSPGCFDGIDGSASISSISYGATIAQIDDFSYAWSSQSTNTSSSVNGLLASNPYFVTAEDGFGCQGVLAFELTQPEAIQIVLVNSEDIKCFNGADGVIEVEAIGGTGPYTFKWGQDAFFQEGNIASNLPAGNFSVSVTDANGCQSQNNFVLNQPVDLEVDFRIFDVLCAGESDGEVEVILSGGTPPFNYLWSTQSDNSIISGLSIGEYFITITDANNCMFVDSVMINQPEDPVDFDYDISPVSCFGGRDGVIDFTAFGGSGIYAYSTDGLSFTGSSSQVGIEAGTYTIYVKDSNGCVDSIPNVQVPEASEIQVDIGPDVLVNYGADVNWEASINNGIGLFSYQWNSYNENRLTCQNCETPILQNVIDEMIVELIVTDENACTGRDEAIVAIQKYNYVRVPKGFTPNADGINDILNVFGPVGTKIKSFKLYSRWGELVFEANDFLVNDLTVGWDGTFKNEPMNQALFVWTVEVEYIDGTTELVKGNTTLIK